MKIVLDANIVTGDKDLLDLKRFRSVPIVDPRGFSTILGEKLAE